MKHSTRLFILLLGIVIPFTLLGPTSSSAREGVKNNCPKTCYPMLIMRVIDADTVQGYIHTSDDVAVIYAKLRLDGIDTPEPRRLRCMEEKLLALLAKEYLANRLAPIIQARSANHACACDARGRKFAKRRVGSLKIKRPGSRNWQDVGRSLMKKCFAVSYRGGKRVDWCSCLKHNNCPSDKFQKDCISRFKRKSR